MEPDNKIKELKGMGQNQTEKLMTSCEAAAYLQLSYPRFRRMQKALPSWQIHDRGPRIYRKVDLDKYTNEADAASE